MFAANYDGLKKRETYNEIVEYLQYGQEKIKYPNRRAKQLRESPQLSNLLDGYGMGLMDMEEDEEMAKRRQIMELKVREVAKKQKTTAQLLRSNVKQLTAPQHYNIADSDTTDWGEAEEFLDEQKKDDDDKRDRGAGAVKMMLEEAVRPESHSRMVAGNLVRVAQASIPLLQIGAAGVAAAGVAVAGATLVGGLVVAAAPYAITGAAIYGGFHLIPNSGHESSPNDADYDPPNTGGGGSSTDPPMTQASFEFFRRRIRGKTTASDSDNAAMSKLLRENGIIAAALEAGRRRLNGKTKKK